MKAAIISIGDIIFALVQYIEDICFIEVNTNYISSSELKTSEFSRVRSTSENFYVFNSRTLENFDVFNSLDEIYLVFTEKSKFYFYFIQNTDIFQCTSVAVKKQKPKSFENK